MTRNREFSDRWPAPKSGKPELFNNWQRPKRDLRRSRPRTRPPAKAPMRPPPPPPMHQSAQNLATPEGSPLPPSQPQPKPLRRWLNKWQFWAALIVLTTGGVGLTAVALLLKLPTVPNCPAIFWPTASASMRLYCAQLAANKQTAKDLLEAIGLVNELPKDHPLRPEIDRQIEQWSLNILTIGEEQFQAGQLDEAIKIARRIPTGVSAYKLVEKQIERWQGIWSDAQQLYEKAEQELKQSNWNQAFREAVKLTSSENKFWATVKYKKLLDLIQIGREASAKLDKAYKLSKSNRVDDILEAIKQAQEIPAESFAYKEAQNLIAECGNRLLKLAEARLDRRDWQGVLEIANKLPAALKLPEVKADLIDLANALSSAQSGTVADLEAAVASAQKLGADRPLYDRAQLLISRWQREIEDVGRLERARTFASSGLASDLRIAITEAQQIPSGNPRHEEARGEIRRWTAKAETIEDQPYLDRARQLATFGGVPALQEAIQEASRIAPGRTLYSEAQTQIREWTNTIQRQQDQPFLNQARSLADSGNLTAAIAAAQQIRSGRALYSEAQSLIKTWQTEIQGQQRLQQAYQTANPGTPQALAAAIQVARQVPTASSARREVRTLVNRWSYQLLSLANDRALYNVTEAISIAQLIPSGTEAYADAQAQIQEWQRSLAPSPVNLPPGSEVQF